MTQLTENVITAAKLETTYGTDAVPTGADALVTSGVKLTPLEMRTVSRDLDKPSSGSDQELVVEHYAMIEFNVELVGSGTLGTAPAFGKLLRACRVSQTIVAATSVSYVPDRSNTDSLSIYFWIDGNRHKLLGSRGTFTLEVNSQGIPYLKFKFTGLHVAPDANAAPTSLAGWEDFQIPVPVTFENTPTPTLHGYTGVFVMFNFDAGNDVVSFNNPGEREIRIVGHKAKGSITMLSPLVSEINFFNIARNSTLGTMKVEHGTAAATKWIFEAADPSVQILKPNYGDDQGRVTLEADLLFVPPNGASEWELRFAAA